MSDNSIDPMPEFDQIQLEQSMETFRMIQGKIFSVVLGLTVADVTLIGFAVEGKNAWIALIGAVCFVIMYLYIFISRQFLNASVLTALSIEKKYGSKDIDWLVTSCIKNSTSKQIREQLLNEFPYYNSNYTNQRKPTFGFTKSRYGAEITLFVLFAIQVVTCLIIAC